MISCIGEHIYKSYKYKSTRGVLTHIGTHVLEKERIWVRVTLSSFIKQKESICYQFSNLVKGKHRIIIKNFSSNIFMLSAS